MGQEIDWEIREQAEELYIVDGHTYDQVAEITGVSVSQLKNWGRDGKWKEKRLEYRQSMRDIKSSMVKLRKNLFKKALESLDPQDIYAAVRLENVAAKQAPKEGPVADVDRPKAFLEDLEFIAETLKDIDPQGLKVLARNFDIIVDRFKDKHAQTTKNN